MGDSVVMLSLYPEFPQAVMSSVASSGEFVFLLDRSGSMHGERIKNARVLIMSYSSHEHIYSVCLSQSDPHLILLP